MTDRPDPLDALCRRLGVQRRWEAGGETHVSPAPAVVATLRELGAPLPPGEVPADDVLADALRAVRLEGWTRPLEPVSVAWDGAAAELPVRLPAADAEGPLELRVVLEDGGVAERSVGRGEVRWEETVELDGRSFRRGRVPLPRLPRGRHDVTLRVGDREATTRLVRAPATTWDGPAEGDDRPPENVDGWRAWGAFLPLYALRTARDHGVGSLSDLAALARWVRERGGDFVGTLPLLPTFLGDREGRPGPGLPVDPSPYVPVSRLFWNELHLDVTAAPGLEEAPEARAVLASEAHRREAERLRGGDRADHAAVMAWKRRVLEPLAEAVASDAAGTGLSGLLERYAAETPEAVQYARFRARLEETEEPWPAWTGDAGDGRLGPDAVSPGLVAYHLYAQWAAAEQMAGLAAGSGGDGSVAGLYLDLPLGCHPLGFDVWRHRDDFAAGATGGAPPDAFFAGGQDWGFPPLHPRRSRERGHDYFAASVRHLMGACSMLRVDHVMSLHRLFWVPDGGGPADGVYVRYPAEELWAELCLESRRNRCEVVGEDLGTVPPEVPEAMARRRARRMWVLPFEVGPVTSAAAGAGKDRMDGDDPTDGKDRMDGADRTDGTAGPDGAEGDDASAATAREGAPDVRASVPPARSVASLNTHDMPPFAAFWRADDVDDRVERGHLAADRADEERAERERWARAVARLVDVEGGAHAAGAGDEAPEGGESPAALPDAADVLPGALEHVARSPARLVLVNLEDLWGERRPQNRPGTAGPENWSLRAARTLEEMGEDDRVLALLDRVERARRAAGAGDASPDDPSTDGRTDAHTDARTDDPADADSDAHPNPTPEAPNR